MSGGPGAPARTAVSAVTDVVRFYEPDPKEAEELREKRRQIINEGDLGPLKELALVHLASHGAHPRNFSRRGTSFVLLRRCRAPPR